MATSTQQDREFITAVAPNALETAMEWIGANLNPGDVFTDDALTEWARRNSTPEDCFDAKALGAWAENNGYVESDE